MHWAARNGRTEVCAWLHFAHGVSVDDPTSDGTTPFHLAVWRGHVDTCRWLVDAARADWTTTNAFGCNASQWAAQRTTGSVAMCAYLRDAGVDLTVLNRNGHSAVHKAAVKGNRDACEWLLARGGLGPPPQRAAVHVGQREHARREPVVQQPCEVPAWRGGQVGAACERRHLARRLSYETSYHANLAPSDGSRAGGDSTRRVRCAVCVPCGRCGGRAARAPRGQ